MTDPTWIVHVRDAVDPTIAVAADYTSPPHTREAALALVTLLVGRTSADGGTAWTLAIAGGRRTVTLEPAP